MGIPFPPVLEQAKGMMGVQYPGSDEFILAQSAMQWGQVAFGAGDATKDLVLANKHIQDNNEGPDAAAFLGYMIAKSNVTGTGAFTAATGIITAAMAIVTAALAAIKVAIIAMAAVVQALLMAAKAFPMFVNPSIPMTVAQQLGGVVRQMDGMLANVIRGN